MTVYSIRPEATQDAVQQCWVSKVDNLTTALGEVELVVSAADLLAVAESAAS